MEIPMEMTRNDFQKCTPYVTEVTGLLSDPLKVIIACRVHQNALNTYSQKKIQKYLYHKIPMAIN